MHIFYRISDGSYKKERFAHATKEHCFFNFAKEFDTLQNTIHVYMDNVKDETWENWRILLRNTLASGYSYIRSNGGSSAGGFRIVFEEALKLSDDELVMFAEDDYLYLPNANQVLLEGLERSHYCSLYDHMDKYISADKGGNPYIESDGGEITKVYLTKSSHWKLTNSTTLTFATSVRILRQDKDIWNKHISGTHPNDFAAFIELRQQKDRTLVTPIPGYATHCEPKWASPLISWENI